MNDPESGERESRSGEVGSEKTGPEKPQARAYPPMREGETLLIGGTVEVILGLSALALIWAGGTKVSWEITGGATFTGAAGAVVLFLASRLISRAAGRSGHPWAREVRRFRDQVSIPLCEILSVPNAIALSILAGLCEELFFRGALQPLVGIALTAVAFTLLHFGPRIREWRVVPVIYLLVSLFFSGLYSFSYSLWAAIVAHALYDAIVLIDLKRTAAK